MPLDRERMPGTLKRSPAKARRTYGKTLESAEKTYDGDEERAHRAAYAAVKHSFEKVGDHWEPKGERGPSDERAARGGRNPRGRSAGGVDVLGHTRDELLERARRLDITGRSRMNKHELGQAIARKEGSRTGAGSTRSSTGGRSTTRSSGGRSGSRGGNRRSRTSRTGSSSRGRS